MQSARARGVQQVRGCTRNVSSNAPGLTDPSTRLKVMTSYQHVTSHCLLAEIDEGSKDDGNAEMEEKIDSGDIKSNSVSCGRNI